MTTMTEIVSAIMDTVTYLHDETSKIYQRSGQDSLEGSQAQNELGKTPSKETLVTAFSQGAMLIEVAGDQLTAFCKTITNPVQTIAPWTCARSEIEAAALGCWLMDTSITDRERLQRSFAFRYEGLIQQKRYLKALGKIEIAQSVHERIENVEKHAIELGFVPLRDKKKQIHGIGQTMPTITDLVGQTLGKEDTYRLLSAVAHAHFWALNNLSFCPALSSGTVFSTDTASGVSVSFVEKGLSPIPIAVLATEVISSFTELIWRKFRLFGWDHKALRKVYENAYDRIGIKEQMRFWREGVNRPPS